MSDARRNGHGLSIALVGERLERLRQIAVLETDAEARARLDRERPEKREPFARAVARRLDELRALDDLTKHLHAAHRRNR